MNPPQRDDEPNFRPIDIRPSETIGWLASGAAILWIWASFATQEGVWLRPGELLTTGVLLLIFGRLGRLLDARER